MSAPSGVWAKVRAHDRLRRGFDDALCWSPHFALPGELQRRLVADDVVGTFAAIESVAGWLVRTHKLDPADDRERELALEAAHELEDLAHVLRVGLDNYEGMES
jgi:hypothetical protein